MTKSDIAKQVQAKLELPHHQCAQLVDSVLQIMKQTLESGEQLKISKFGSFEVRQKRDRLGRNPQTGESLTIESRKVLVFKPSHGLKARLNAA